jgi:hypothetical protein
MSIMRNSDEPRATLEVALYDSFLCVVKGVRP